MIDREYFSNRRIVFVIDDGAIRDVVELVLKAYGFEGETTVCGPGALDLIARVEPDLVVLDCFLWAVNSLLAGPRLGGHYRKVESPQFIDEFLQSRLWWFERVKENVPTRKAVCIIDDAAVSRKVKALLRPWGFDAVGTICGSDALDLIATVKPDMVLVSCESYDMNTLLVDPRFAGHYQKVTPPPHFDHSPLYRIVWFERIW